MKTAAKVLAVVVFFACLGWVGLSLYWHFKILGAIRTMQSEAGPAKPGSALGYSVPEEPMKEIEAAGCRALSYLVDSLEPSKNPAYLVAACVLISKATVPDPSKPPARPGLSTESMISARMNEVSGVTSLGLTMTEQPAARAGATLAQIWCRG